MSDKSKRRITLAGRLAIALILAATTYILPAYGACTDGSTRDARLARGLRPFPRCRRRAERTARRPGIR